MDAVGVALLDPITQRGGKHATSHDLSHSHTFRVSCKRVQPLCMACLASPALGQSWWQARNLHAELGAPQMINLPDLDCDERYFSHVTCAGQHFLFSRREFSCCDMWDTMLRIAPYGTSAFGPSEVTLSHALNMSHNTAFLCMDNRTLVAIGGQLPDGIFTMERLRWHPGILRRHADATMLPLKWSHPSLVASAIKAKSHCVDARFGMGCDFDGKISAIEFNGRLLIFSRANLLKPLYRTTDAAAELEEAGDMQAMDAGGRHVQVGEAQPLVSRFGWSETRHFRPIQLEGFDQPKRSNNIYFWTVQPISRHALLALFPAVLSGDGGVWCSTSTDGVHWARPLRVIRTPVVHGVRTPVHPVEYVGTGLKPRWRQPWQWLAATHNVSRADKASTFGSGSKDGAVLIQHNVYFHLAQKEPGCKDILHPHLCAYQYRRTGVATRCAAIRHAFQQHASMQPRTRTESQSRV